jgi:uncharacterized protein (DUF1697 family)
MTYVALLRGINVGGNNKVAMKTLKAAFETAGMERVSTYINSGNVIFSSTETSIPKLTGALEAAIKRDCGLQIKVLVKNIASLRAIAKALPDSWQNNSDMKCDVMFLWEHYDNKSVLDQVTIKPDVDEVRYQAGAILWKVMREGATRSGIQKLIGTELYRHMTLRNCNTTRKLLELMEAVEAK